MSDQQSIMKVTGLGQLARLIELGCNVGLATPCAAISQHCSQAGDGRAPVAAGCDTGQARVPGDMGKEIVEYKVPRATDGGAAIASSSGRLKLAVRKDTPVVKPVRRASIKRALAAGAPGKRAET